MGNVAIDMSRAIEFHLFGAQAPDQLAPDIDSVGRDGAFNKSGFPNRQALDRNVAPYYAIEVNFALTVYVALDDHVIAYQRGNLLGHARTVIRR